MDDRNQKNKQGQKLNPHERQSDQKHAGSSQDNQQKNAGQDNQNKRPGDKQH